MSQQKTEFRLFSFDDYRPLIRAWIQAQPRQGWGQSARLAAAAGINTSLMSHVLVGKRDLTFDQALKIAEFIQLNESETDFFLILVELSRAGTERSIEYWQKRRAVAREKANQVSNLVREEIALSDSTSRIFYSSPIYSAIRVLSSIGAGITDQEVARRCNLPENQAKECIEFLLESRLCVRINGKLQPGPQVTVAAKGTSQYRSHHTNWRLASIRAVDRDIGGTLITAPLSLSQKDFAAIRDELLVLIKSVSERVRSGTPEIAACLNLDLFPLENL
jgi:uncharacterized protein (TIGR02147 family)